MWYDPCHFLCFMCGCSIPGCMDVKDERKYTLGVAIVISILSINTLMRTTPRVMSTSLYISLHRAPGSTWWEEMKVSSNECVACTTTRTRDVPSNRRASGCRLGERGFKNVDRMTKLPRVVLVANECIPLLQTRVAIIVKATIRIATTPSVLP